MNDVKQFASDKILKHLDKVTPWLLDHSNVSPVTAEIDMTNICNHKCSECVVGYFQKKDSSVLKKEFAESIIGQLASAGVKGLIFTGGGEPLCCSYTPDMIVRAKESGLDVGLITNGSLINEDNVDILVNNCTWIRVSLDAEDSKMYKATHGMGENSLQKVYQNIKLLVGKRIIAESKCTIGVGYLTSKDTVPAESFDHIVLICKVYLGVDYIQFRPMQIHRGGKFEYNWTDIVSKIESCLKYSNGNFDVLYSKHKYDMMKIKDFGRDYKICYGHQFAVTVCANGKMYLCCHLRGYEKYCIGDLTKNTFEEIWRSEQRKDVYNRIDFKDCIPLCRCNTFNQVLWSLKQEREHVNFL
jgi:MoaA/NifB/PqqE/SkfB family radical SAM enzyme